MPLRSPSPKHFKWLSKTSFVEAIFFVVSATDIAFSSIFILHSCSTKHWCHFLDLFFPLGRDLLDRGKKVRGSHAGAQISPAHPFEPRGCHPFTLVFGYISSRVLHKVFDVDFRLLFDPVVEKPADVSVFLKGLVDFLLGSSL